MKTQQQLDPDSWHMRYFQLSAFPILSKSEFPSLLYEEHISLFNEPKHTSIALPAIKM
ncbi:MULTISPECIES: hypothetical protein [Bacteroidales]|uniref:hypothetical protein n=1 Tax=Bacteroidales TaxID=171549 RepID=UPI0012B60EF9|nr:hypothetical protein [Gabonia massiliensis]